MKIDRESCKRILADVLKEYTDLEDTVVDEMVDFAPLDSFDKGHVLQHQGQEPSVATYFIVKGCIRQYICDENGREITVNFYTENEPINLITFLDEKGKSLYSLSCIESCIVAYCEDIEDDGSNDPPEIQALEQLFFRKQYAQIQRGYADFKLKSPEERFEFLLEQEAELIERVPQIYLASYIGITPESFSRFKKRKQKEG
jgi:CRP-like cAMP-binding protein